MGFHFLNNICIVPYKGNDRIKLSVLIHLQLILRGKYVHRIVKMKMCQMKFHFYRIIIYASFSTKETIEHLHILNDI